MSRFRVRFAKSAIDDLARLTEVMVERSPERAAQVEPTLRDAVEVLRRLPWVGRIAREQSDRSLRELLVPFGSAGYVILYRVGPGALVSILAAKHMLEGRYH